MIPTRRIRNKPLPCAFFLLLFLSPKEKYSSFFHEDYNLVVFRYALIISHLC